MNNDNELVISDFGLGRIVNTESTRQTQTGYQLGTLYYMAPEQLKDAKRADHRSDIFSIGRIIYELYTEAISSAVQDTSLLPSGIAFIVNRCTNSDPGKRFQSVGDLKNSWKGLFEISSWESELNELVELRAKLTAPATLEEKK